MQVLKVDKNAQIPTRAHSDDAGLDLYSLMSVTLAPGEGLMLRTGIAMAIPRGHVGLIADRSSLGKKGLKTLGGVIDAGYRGEIQVLVRNLSSETLQIQAGDRCAQLLILPVAILGPVEVQSFESSTTRGEGGFGSSGA